MRLRFLIALLAVLSISTSARSQFPTEANFEHSFYGGMPALLPFYADAVFAANDAAVMRLKPSVQSITVKLQGGDGAEPDAASASTFHFDHEGNITRASLSGDPAVIEFQNAYEDQFGKQMLRNQVVSGRTENEARHRCELVYDDKGTLRQRLGAGWAPGTDISFEYRSGKPHRATAARDGEKYIVVYDDRGRLIERSEGARDQSRTEITWIDERTFEVQSVQNSTKKLEGKGTLDDHGSLSEWSWQGMTSEPRLVNFRNEISYDEHGNWTRLVTYVQTQPDDARPSKPLLAITREITYR